MNRQWSVSRYEIVSHDFRSFSFKFLPVRTISLIIFHTKVCNMDNVHVKLYVLIRYIIAYLLQEYLFVYSNIVYGSSTCIIFNPYWINIIYAYIFLIFNHGEMFFLGITYVRQYVCVCVCVCMCVCVCLCDYSHTVQPRAFKFWHNIPYLNI